MRYSAPRRRSRALKPVDTVAESGRLETPRFGHLMGSLYAAESDSVGPLALAHARQALERCEPPRVGFGNRQYESGAAAGILPSEVFWAWQNVFLFRRE